jgi:phosphohistidine phosphatase
MSPKLILMRHAKSAWGDPEQDDHARPLNARGRDAAPRIGAWLRAEGFVPTRALVSDAARTRETWERLGFDRAPELRPDLYLAEAGAILRLAEGAEGTLLILAHNPGMAEAALRAVDRAPTHPEFERYPTCATLVVDLSEGLPGRKLAFAVPRDLTGV